MELTSSDSLIERYPILSLLDASSVYYQLFEHPAVFTVGECADELAHIPGQGTKNLFVRDKKKTKFALYTVSDQLRVDLKQFGQTTGLGHVSFASADDLRQHLQVEPGSVTPLAMVNASQLVTFYFDRSLLNAELIQFHPLKNTATIVMKPYDLCDRILKDNGVVVNLL